MNIETLRKRFELWKYLLFINIGASVTLFLQMILTYVESPRSYLEISWYAVWFVAVLASFLPGFVLLWGKHWVQIPLPERLNVIFGYFAITWFNLMLIGIYIGRDTSKSFNVFLLGCAAAIAVSYWRLRRKSTEIFP